MLVLAKVLYNIESEEMMSKSELHNWECAIEYLRAVRKVCTESGGNYRECPLGKQKKLADTLCPRLMHPNTWSDAKTTAMVRKRGA